MVRLAEKREVIAHIQSGFDVSERRACKMTRWNRKTIGYQSCRPEEGVLRQAIRNLAEERRRFG